MVGITDGSLVAYKARAIALVAPSGSAPFIKFAMLVSAGLVDRAMPWLLSVSESTHDRCASVLQRMGYVSHALNRSYLTGLTLEMELSICLHNANLDGAVALLRRGFAKSGPAFVGELLRVDGGYPESGYNAGALATIPHPSPWLASSIPRHRSGRWSSLSAAI